MPKSYPLFEKIMIKDDSHELHNLSWLGLFPSFLIMLLLFGCCYFSACQKVPVSVQVDNKKSLDFIET